jgi:pyruvate, water dikinase
VDYIICLDRLDKNDVKKAGGKGANLGEMVKAGIPVPTGFVITTSAFDLLVWSHDIGERIRQAIRNTDVEETFKLVEASDKIKEMILSHKMPPEIESRILEAYRRLSEVGKTEPRVGVRSSATAEDLPTASFAGQQASFLNVKGDKELIE